MGKPRVYTAEEDRIIFEMGCRQAAELIGRSIASVRIRRCKLRHPPERAAKRARWTAAEKALLREQYPVIDEVRNLVGILKRFTFYQITTQARFLKLRRKYLGQKNVRVEGHCELVDQIRIRAREDGITMSRLDKVLKTGQYFQIDAYKRKYVNLVPVARALDFFGGTLVIDWRDR